MIVAKDYLMNLGFEHGTDEMVVWGSPAKLRFKTRTKINLSLHDESELSFYMKSSQTKKLEELFKKITDGSKMVIEIKISEEK